MLVERELFINGEMRKKLVFEPAPPKPAADHWISSESLVGLETLGYIPPWWTLHAVPLPVVEYERNLELAVRLGLTEEDCWEYQGRHLIILHHGTSDPPTRLLDGRAAARGQCFYDADVAAKLTKVMSDWVSKEVERADQRKRVKQRLDEEAADLARQYMQREQAKAEIERQALENTPESRMRRLEQQMRQVMQENEKLKQNGHESR
jgi:hypothetical protein